MQAPHLTRRVCLPGSGIWKNMISRYLVRAFSFAVGLYFIAQAFQEALIRHFDNSRDLAPHIEQLGLGLLAGAIFGATSPWLVKAWPVATALFVSAAYAGLHALFLQSDASMPKLVEGMLGVFVGVRMMAAVLKSWSAMYERHLESYGSDARGTGHRDDREPTMSEWNAGQYLKFEDERTRPAIDLLARVPLSDPKRCIDLGCGPGNSTELLVKRYPNATITGLNSSAAMLEKARERLPDVAFEIGDIANWSPSETFDLIFANAALQWVPGHASLLPRLVAALNPGGYLAVQVPNNLHEPSHVLMREVAARGPWASRLAGAMTAREQIGSFGEYYTYLRQAGCSVDLWRTTYVHCLEDAGAIVEWVKATGLRPFLDPLDEAEQKDFLALYQAEIAKAYQPQFDGKVLLPFPRLFMVARRG